MTRTVTLVAGPPCAGKTTHVQERAQAGDIVLDQDVIGAKAMREGMDQVRAMTTGTAWVIRCAAGPARRARLAEWLGVTDVVVLRPPDDVLLARATQRDHPRRHIQAVRKWLTTEAEDMVDAKPIIIIDLHTL